MCHLFFVIPSNNYYNYTKTDIKIIETDIKIINWTLSRRVDAVALKRVETRVFRRVFHARLGGGGGGGRNSCRLKRKEKVVTGGYLVE